MVDNAISPFSRALSYEGPDNSGFLGTPRSSQFAQPWGEPFKDEAGNKIDPGTLGGPNSKALLSKKKSTWSKRQTAVVQDVGEISWYGKKQGTKPDAKKLVLSFHGPVSRHFAQEFEFGSSSTHKEVYRQGGLVGIAPGPVLGAAVQSIAVGSPPEEKDHLNVVCKYSGREVLMRRLLEGPFYRSNFGEDTEARLSEFKSDDNPNGWVVIGDVNIPSEYDPAKTPWFFNESGTEAQCIRMKEKQGLDRSGAPVPEKAGDRFLLKVFATSISLQPKGNEEPFEFTETGVSIDLGIFNSPADTFGWTHSWYEHRVSLNTTMKGKQVVAVDYVGDTEVLVTAVMDVKFSFDKDYMKGRDNEFGAVLRGPYDNRGQFSNPQELGSDRLNFSVGDHLARLWEESRSSLSLNYVVNGVEYVIPLELTQLLTSDQYSRLGYIPPNRDAFFRQYLIQYPRYLDVRGGGMFCARFYSNKLFILQSRGSISESEVVDTVLVRNDSQTTIYLGGSEDWKPRSSIPIFPLLNNLASWDFVRALPPTAWTWSTKSYVGTRPRDNDGGVVGQLQWPTWVSASETVFYNGWYGLTILNHPYFTSECGFAHREDGSYVVSGVFPDPDTKALKEAQFSAPFDVGTLTSGVIFHPLGEI